MHPRILRRLLYIIPLLATLAGCAELDAQRTRLAEQDRTIQRLRDENRQFQDAYYKIKDQLDSQNGQSQKDIERLTRDLEQARSTRTQKEKELGDQLRARTVEFEAIKRDTLDQRVQTDSRLATLQSAITSATAQRDDALARQREAEAKLSAEQARAADLARQVAQFKIDAKTMSDQLAVLQKTATDHETALKAEKDARQGAERQLTDVQGRLDAQARQLQLAQTQAGELRKQLDSAARVQADADQQRKETERLKTENRRLADEAAATRQALAAKPPPAAGGDDMGTQAAELENRLKSVIARGVRVRQDSRGIRVIIPNALIFAQNKATLADDAEKALSPIAQALRQTGNSPIGIEGHTDNQPPTPPYADNWRLGFARADSVREFLMRDGGIESGRLAVQSRAQANPIASNDTSEGRAQNRRIEIVIGPRP